MGCMTKESWSILSRKKRYFSFAKHSDHICSSPSLPLSRCWEPFLWLGCEADHFHLLLREWSYTPSPTCTFMVHFTFYVQFWINEFPKHSFLVCCWNHCTAKALTSLYESLLVVSWGSWKHVAVWGVGTTPSSTWNMSPTALATWGAT